jgi:hypothetical protein
MNMHSDARKRGAVPAVLTHKGAMNKLIDHLKEMRQHVPRFNLTLKYFGANFMLDINTSIAKWDSNRLALFYRECTGQQMPSYKTWEEHIHDVKLVIMDIFWITDFDTDEVSLETAKMWPGGVTTKKQQENEEMATKNGKTSKAAATKDADKPEVASKAKAKTGKATKPEKVEAPKKEKRAKGSNGQFAPIGTTDWGKVPETMKVVRGEAPTGPEDRVKAFNLIPNGKAGITVGKWLEAISKTLKVKPPKAKAIAWPLLNRFHAKKS